MILISFRNTLQSIVFLWTICMHAQINTNSEVILFSEFSSEPIKIDGEADTIWEKVKTYSVEKSVSPNLSKQASGKIQSIWDGATLYLFIQVKDNDLSNNAEKITDQDGVEIYIDLWNDKYPKYLEDDGLLYVTAKGEQMTRGTDVDRFKVVASKPIYDIKGNQTGYTVEMAFHLGGIPLDNGSKIGLEIGINDVSSKNNVSNKIFWSSTNNNGLNDTSKWGTIVLNGYDKKLVKAIDFYSLKTNIQKAEKLSLGIWKNEQNLIQALKEAKEALNKNDNSIVEQSNLALKKAIKELRRKGSYADPYDLPEIKHLPDPFTFQSGEKVKKPVGWKKRAKEIKAMAQYYEYGKLPESPEQVKATLKDKKLIVSIEDQGKTVKFEAQLTIPKQLQNANRKKIPIIVSIDFSLREADSIYLNAGYAVLNFRYTSVASDNLEHTGPFYDLYPYNIKTGNDTGTLLAWAWGAIRCVDALEYLTKHDSSIEQTLDLEKIVVTGFSRCGKAALAAGLFDDRFGVVSPGASGCGGAAAFRYVSFGNLKRGVSYGNEYPWGQSPGCEVLGDKIRHQKHNSNEMLARFLDPDRIYKTSSYGYAERLPYDHHEIIAAIAPRAVLITTANDDYANNAEGDAIGLEGAKPVFKFLGVPEKLGFNLRTTGESNPWGYGGGHWRSQQQNKNLIHFSNMVFYKTPLPEKLKEEFYSNPYLPTFNKYYGGTKKMMPWLSSK